jgi:mono/diheme cytochrome c family protein
MSRTIHSALFVVCCAIAASAAAQTPSDGAPSDTIESGRDTYIFHCAACHGRDGRGDGPVMSALKSRPSDLTTIARRRGGRFPRAEIAMFVTGERRGPAAHGSSDMPVWGPLFRQLNPFDSRVDIRLNRLVEYLQSIQVK